MQEYFDNFLHSLAGCDNARFLVAVSGGIDSISLASLFANSALQPYFEIAHVNFSLRGEDSDADQALVEQWSASHNVKCHTIRFDTKTYAEQHSLSTQMAARELRYEWFASLLRQYNLDYLAVAHNKNDNAETMMLNLLRGTGLKGICGMQPVNGNIIRPLLHFTRAEIAAYVAKHKISYRDDASNFESHYHRNRLRNDVFPHFKEINPSFLNTLEKEMGRFYELNQILDAQFVKFCDRNVIVHNSHTSINFSELQQDNHANYWLFRLMQPYGFNESQIAEIAKAIKQPHSGIHFISATYKAVFANGCINVYPIDNHSTADIVLDVFKIPEGFDYKNPPIGHLYIDAEKIGLTVTGRHCIKLNGSLETIGCRKWQDGDRFRPLGMKGWKKLSDYFTDKKIDIEQKRQQMILTTSAGDQSNAIFAIVGHCIDHRFRITKETRLVAEIYQSI